MVGIQSLPKAPHRATPPTTLPSRFGNTTQAAARTSAEVVSETVYPYVKKLAALDIGKIGNLSLEDWAARSLTLFGLYIPQGIISFWNDNHIWETNGRNVVMWTLAILVAGFSKSDTYGVNTFLDVFMQNSKVDNPEALTRIKAVANKIGLNKLGIDGDYIQVLEDLKLLPPKSDRSKALWASLDSNTLDRAVFEYNQLAIKAADKTIAQAEQKTIQATMKTLGQFLKRRNAFNLVSTGVMMALSTWLIGKFAMDMVFKYIAPLDHDFVPLDKRNKNKAPSHQQKPPASVPTPYSSQQGMMVLTQPASRSNQLAQRPVTFQRFSGKAEGVTR
jgi:hypothetical protein